MTNNYIHNMYIDTATKFNTLKDRHINTEKQIHTYSHIYRDI